MGLGVTSFSGPSSNPWVAITGNCTNVNIHSARTEKGRTSDDWGRAEGDTLEGLEGLAS
jgi:hypothetical protein